MDNTRRDLEISVSFPLPGPRPCDRDGAIVRVDGERVAIFAKREEAWDWVDNMPTKELHEIAAKARR